MTMINPKLTHALILYLWNAFAAIKTLELASQSPSMQTQERTDFTLEFFALQALLVQCASCECSCVVRFAYFIFVATLPLSRLRNFSCFYIKVSASFILDSYYIVYIYFLYFGVCCCSRYLTARRRVETLVFARIQIC